MSTSSSAYEAAWSVIDREKRRDRFVRRLSIAAWTTTFVVLSIFAAIMVARIVLVHQRVTAGMDFPQATYEAALPLVAVIGVLSLLIATLATVGIFLRLRTASLIEIQLRLANLEDMMRSERQDASDRDGAE